MRDPAARSPQEWAEGLHEDASVAIAHSAGLSARRLSAADCRELADRMDDLAEALRLLRDTQDEELDQGLVSRSIRALLAKYAEPEVES